MTSDLFLTSDVKFFIDVITLTSFLDQLDRCDFSIFPTVGVTGYFQFCFGFYVIEEMSTRKLRRGTRKDYRKLAGVTDDEHEHASDQVSDFNEYLRESTGVSHGSDIECDERSLSGDVVSDTELERMEEELQTLRIEEENHRKREKFRRLSQETANIKESLRKFREKEVNIRTLRDMDDVVEEGDKLMGKSGKKSKEKNRKNKDRSHSSSSSETDDSSCDSSEDEIYEETVCEKKQRKKEKSKEETSRKKKEKESSKKEKRKSETNKKKKVAYESSCSSDENISSSGSETDDESDSSDLSSGEKDKRRSAKKAGSKKSSSKKKKKSGKDLKITSSVKNPQKWPHAHLAQHFVSRGKKYEELSLAEFCAGYATILNKTKSKKRKHRITHLEDLMCLATRFQWRSVLNYHAAVLMEIERGNAKWGDSFEILKNTTLVGSHISHQRGGNGSFGHGANNLQQGSVDRKTSRTLFCRQYQQGICSHSGDHQGVFEGKEQLLKHICAKCWLGGRKMASHPETSNLCPFFEEGS